MAYIVVGLYPVRAARRDSFKGKPLQFVVIDPPRFMLLRPLLLLLVLLLVLLRRRTMTSNTAR